MSRIDRVFSDLQRRGGTALVPYIAAGYPSMKATVPVMHALVAEGAQMIELGIPFSDPMADGPVIQVAYEKAVAAGVGLLDVLQMVADFRERDASTPVILMGYLNPVERLGYEHFSALAGNSGVDGVLLVDAPPEESLRLTGNLRDAGVSQIFLAAPTTTVERFKRIAAQASGFIYYVSMKGITGARSVVVGEVQEQLAWMRELTNLPLGVGFGIKDAESAAALSKIADAVVIGSALVQAIAVESDPAACAARAGAFIAPIREAIDRACGV